MKTLYYGCLIVFATCGFCYGGDKLTVAAAINFIRPMTALEDSFEPESGIQLSCSYGSSGKLYAQLLHGAPYDIFLSADYNRPEMLYKQGICNKPFAYAQGAVVLWSGDKGFTTATWKDALATHSGKVAIASPKAAPYGKTALEALEATGLYDALRSRLIYGQSIGQTFLFAETGGTKFAFIALSQAISPKGQQGQYWPIPESRPVEQFGCIVKHSNTGHAKQLQDYLLSPQGKKIIHLYGYQ